MRKNWPDFTTVDWEDLYKRLLLAAAGRLRRSRLSQSQATDFIHTAIQKAMSGQRVWDPTKSLYHNLWQIVSSEINHAATSYERVHVDPSDETIVQIRDYRDTPEEASIHKSEIDHLMHYLNSRDRDAAAVADLLLTVGISNSMEVAVQLNRSVSEIDNIKKRLRRLCKNYAEEVQRDSHPRNSRSAKITHSA
jgi:hypothetical protein